MTNPTESPRRNRVDPFGDVIDIPQEAGRTYYEDALGNLRGHAKPSLSVSLKPPTPDRPLKSELMERQERECGLSDRESFSHWDEAFHLSIGLRAPVVELHALLLSASCISS